MKYQDENAKTIARWIEEGWEWGKPISHEEYIDALNGKINLYLTPTKTVPMDWFGDLKGKKVLGLASGGGQQMPLLTALGAKCTVLDYTKAQLDSEVLVANREGYAIEIVQADMSKPLPFEDESFDFICHPVSNVYVEEVKPIFKECYRILKHGGVMIGGYDNGINFIGDDNEERIVNKLPYNPLKNPEHLKQLQDNDCGYQFSHTIEEQLGGQLEAGFMFTHLYEDTNGEGRLHELNIPTFIAVRSVKQ